MSNPSQLSVAPVPSTRAARPRKESGVRAVHAAQPSSMREAFRLRAGAVDAVEAQRRSAAFFRGARIVAPLF